MTLYIWVTWAASPLSVLLSGAPLSVLLVTFSVPKVIWGLDTYPARGMLVSVKGKGADQMMTREQVDKALRSLASRYQGSKADSTNGDDFARGYYWGLDQAVTELLQAIEGSVDVDLIDRWNSLSGRETTHGPY